MLSSPRKILEETPSPKEDQLWSTGYEKDLLQTGVCAKNWCDPVCGADSQSNAAHVSDTLVVVAVVDVWSLNHFVTQYVCQHARFLLFPPWRVRV